MPNHLAGEKSPYLLQHADNPVDWYPWGDAAFGKARAERKPIFLSVGYSTCHWCHVMAHESFENEAVARILNANFVPVKVDREERPDVDRVYMTFVQATTGGGGWPMSVWLTPELEPFYGGTYFPPTSRWGRPGFIETLEEIARLWGDEPDRIRRSAEQVTGQLKRFAASARGQGSLSRETSARILDGASAEFAAAFDSRHGGFGTAPKFPRPGELFFLMHEYARLRPGPVPGATAGRRDVSSRAETCRDMAVKTLDAMARGGICDHLGGGFHRYSVDAEWHVPHFEKMLYDQAQIALAYLDAFQITGAARFADVAAATLRYTVRDLGRPGGGFYSAEDADSPESAGLTYQGPATAAPRRSSTQIHASAGGPESAHPVEGAFYVWTDEEFARVLGEDAEVARLRFGVRPGGNAAADPNGELAGKNVLWLAQSVEQVAAASGQPADETAARLERATRRLFEARAARPRPALDDKVIVAWNGLAIGAFARAARVLNPEWLGSARAAAAFIRDNMWDPDRRRLLRRYRNGETAIEAYAEDYACLVFGLLELFQADGDPGWLEWALGLQQTQDALFWDESSGGWFSTTAGDSSVLLRLKEEYDGAEPAASSVSLWNLLVLARLTGESQWAARIESIFSAFSAHLERGPRALPMMLAALSTSLGRKQEIVVAGREASPDTQLMLRQLASVYLPFAVIVPLVSESRDELARLLPFTAAMTTREGRATAYVCQDFACSRPTTDPAGMLEEIREGALK